MDVNNPDDSFSFFSSGSFNFSPRGPINTSSPFEREDSSNNTNAFENDATIDSPFQSFFLPSGIINYWDDEPKVPAKTEQLKKSALKADAKPFVSSIKDSTSHTPNESTSTFYEESGHSQSNGTEKQNGLPASVHSNGHQTHQGSSVPAPPPRTSRVNVYGQQPPPPPPRPSLVRNVPRGYQNTGGSGSGLFPTPPPLPPMMFPPPFMPPPNAMFRNSHPQMNHRMPPPPRGVPFRYSGGSMVGTDKNNTQSGTGLRARQVRQQGERRKSAERSSSAGSSSSSSSDSSTGSQQGSSAAIQKKAVRTITAWKPKAQQPEHPPQPIPVMPNPARLSAPSALPQRKAPPVPPILPNSARLSAPSALEEAAKAKNRLSAPSALQPTTAASAESPKDSKSPDVKAPLQPDNINKGEQEQRQDVEEVTVDSPSAATSTPSSPSSVIATPTTQPPHSATPPQSPVDSLPAISSNEALSSASSSPPPPPSPPSAASASSTPASPPPSLASSSSSSSLSPSSPSAALKTAISAEAPTALTPVSAASTENTASQKPSDFEPRQTKQIVDKAVRSSVEQATREDEEEDGVSSLSSSEQVRPVIVGQREKLTAKTETVTKPARKSFERKRSKEPKPKSQPKDRKSKTRHEAKVKEVRPQEKARDSLQREKGKKESNREKTTKQKELNQTSAASVSDPFKNSKGKRLGDQTSMVNAQIHPSVIKMIPIVILKVHQCAWVLLKSDIKIVMLLAFFSVFPYLFLAAGFFGPGIMLAFLVWFWMTKERICCHSFIPLQSRVRHAVPILVLMYIGSAGKFIAMWTGGERFMLAFFLLLQKSHAFRSLDAWLWYLVLLVVSICFGHIIVCQWLVVVTALWVVVSTSYSGKRRCIVTNVVSTHTVCSSNELSYLSQVPGFSLLCSAADKFSNTTKSPANPRLKRRKRFKS